MSCFYVTTDRAVTAAPLSQTFWAEADACPTLTAQWGPGGVTTCWDTIRHPLSVLWPSQSIRVYPWHVHPMLSDS